MKGYPAISVAEQRAGGRGRGAAVQGKGEMGGAPAAGSHCHLPALISSGAWRFGLTWHREMQNSLLLPGAEPLQLISLLSATRSLLVPLFRRCQGRWERCGSGG